MLRILWLGQQECILPWLNDLRHGIAKYCDVVSYGLGPEFIPNYDVPEIVEKESPDVIMLGNNQYAFKGLNMVKTPKALKCTDPWANINRHVEFVRKYNVNLILMNYNCATPEYKKHLPNTPIKPLPHTVNPEIFHPLETERDLDVSCVGEGCPDTYPLRNIIYNNITKMGIKAFVTGAHTLTFADYVKTIQRSKIFAFGNVNRRVGESERLIFPMAKIYEIMGCGTLCVMDCPTEWEELYLNPAWNFVSVVNINFKDEIMYYLKHNRERNKVARAGYRMVMKYHTVEVRSRQLYEMLQEIARK